MGIKRAFVELAATSTARLRRLKPIKASAPRLQFIIVNRLPIVLYILAIAVLAAGFMNAYLEGSKVARAIIVLRTPNLQSFNETVINIFTLLLGASSFYLIYHSGRRIVRPQIAYLYLLLGLAGVITSFYVALYISQLKTGF